MVGHLTRLIFLSIKFHLAQNAVTVTCSNRISAGRCIPQLTALHLQVSHHFSDHRRHCDPPGMSTVRAWKSQQTSHLCLVLCSQLLHCSSKSLRQQSKAKSDQDQRLIQTCSSADDATSIDFDTQGFSCAQGFSAKCLRVAKKFQRFFKDCIKF